MAGSAERGRSSGFDSATASRLPVPYEFDDHGRVISARDSSGDIRPRRLINMMRRGTWVNLLTTTRDAPALILTRPKKDNIATRTANLPPCW